MLNELLKEKVIIIDQEPKFLQEWNDLQERKAIRKFENLFQFKTLTDHNGNKRYIKDLESLENFFGLPYTSSSNYAMISNTNTMYYVDNNKIYNLDHVAMDINEDVYIVASDINEQEIYLKIK